MFAGQHHKFQLTKGFSVWGDGIEISMRDKHHYNECIKIKSGEGDYEDWIDTFIAELQEFKAAIIESRQ